MDGETPTYNVSDSGDSMEHRYKLGTDESNSPKRRERTAAEIRKSNKPLMEKRRRERINTCLEQLKSILVEVTNKESSYYSKLEKADILEMTVKYLRNLKRQQMNVNMTNDSNVLSKYMAGFNECTSEITKYLTTVDGLGPDVSTRLLSHLASCLQRTAGVQSYGAQSTPVRLPVPTATPLSLLPGMCVVSSSPATVPTLAAASAVQLVPAKLPSGELVFLLANQQQTSTNECGHNNSAIPAANASAASGQEDIADIASLSCTSRDASTIKNETGDLTPQSNAEQTQSHIPVNIKREEPTSSLNSPNVDIKRITPTFADDSDSDDTTDEGLNVNCSEDVDDEDDEADNYSTSSSNHNEEQREAEHNLPMWRPW